jgi:hypothetical protein
VVVVSGQVGREVDISTTLAAIAPYLLQMEDAVIPLVVEESSPVIMDVGPQAELARKILSEPLVLTAPAVEDEEARSWSIAPEDLASMLVIHRADGEDGESDTYQIGINEA